MSVKPQESQRAPHKSGTKDSQLTDIREIHDIEIVSHDDVTTHPCQQGQGAAIDRCHTCSDAVDAVGEIGSVADSGDDEDNDEHIDHPDQILGPVAHPSDQLGIVDFVILHKGDGRGGTAFDVGMVDNKEAYHQSEQHLSQNLVFARQTGFTPGLLQVVVEESQHAQPDGSANHYLHIDVVELGEEKRRDENGGKNQEATHGGGLSLTRGTLESQLGAHLVHHAHLVFHPADEALAEDKHNEQRCYHACSSAEGDSDKSTRTRDMDTYAF